MMERLRVPIPAEAEGEFYFPESIARQASCQYKEVRSVSDKLPACVSVLGEPKRHSRVRSVQRKKAGITSTVRCDHWMQVTNSGQESSGAGAD